MKEERSKPSRLLFEVEPRKWGEEGGKGGCGTAGGSSARSQLSRMLLRLHPGFPSAHAQGWLWESWAASRKMPVSSEEAQEMRTVTQTPHWASEVYQSGRQWQPRESNYTTIHQGLGSSSTPWLFFPERREMRG